MGGQHEVTEAPTCAASCDRQSHHHLLTNRSCHQRAFSGPFDRCGVVQLTQRLLLPGS